TQSYSAMRSVRLSSILFLITQFSSFIAFRFALNLSQVMLTLNYCG
uniref:Ig-like domain-containing protein n=1 Tax=Parascaris univalens TaxID=6257 RepID=A0A915BY47_PARUN